MTDKKKLEAIEEAFNYYHDRTSLTRLEEKELTDFVYELKEAISVTRCSTQLKDKEDKAFKEWMKLNKVIKTENPSLYLYDNGLLTMQMVRTVYNALKPNL